MFNLHEEIQKSGERFDKKFGYIEVGGGLGKRNLTSDDIREFNAAEQLALAKKIVEELRPEGRQKDWFGNPNKDNPFNEALAEYDAKVKQLLKP